MYCNMIYMNTRGGVSKAQKGLHLNEDIYAGMNAFQRGGRIKHSEYIQCGKGRDLGFCSVLNFNTKICRTKHSFIAQKTKSNNRVFIFL